MRVTKLLLLTAVVVFLSACEKQKVSLDDLSADTDAVTALILEGEQSYLIMSKTDKLPSGLVESLADAGGALESTLTEVGIAVATSSDPSFMTKAAGIKGVGDVVPNLEFDFIFPGETVEFALDEAGSPPFSDNDDPFFNYQWGHTAIQAVDAWEAGYKGAGASVGVLDTGFDLDHPDLVPNINLGLSADFTGEGLQYAIDDMFSHGTHTAGTIAAADNGIGTIGVAPEAELVLIKVLSDEGTGYSSDIWKGIIHAATVGCDVINMSIGSTFYRSAYGYDVPASYIASYKNMYNKVITYAYQQGVTVIASAGNDAIDFDHAADLMHLPSDASNAISISATGPYGWAYDFSVNLDNPASYTNFGQSVIDFAAPGGDFGLYPTPGWSWDMVLSTGNGGWYWSAGTSMASPHAAGVAALIIGKNGGKMSPAQVKAALRASADDLGKPGKDDYYGLGRVNAYNAVK